jgi:PAS domain S-box-containing protein
MFIFAWISLLGGFISFFLGAYVLSQNPKRELNLTFMGICIVLSIVGIAEYGMRSSDNFETALIWTRVADIFPLTIGLLVHFALTFNEKTQTIDRKIIYPFIYIPAFFLTLTAMLTGYMGLYPVRKSWGWSYGERLDPLFSIYVVWSISCAVFSLVLCSYNYFSTSNSYIKKQSKFITLGILTPVVFYFFIDYILSELFKLDIPDMGTSSYIICCIFFAYAMIKYKLFTLDLQRIARKILYNISNILILVDENGCIKEVNQAVVSLFGYPKKSLYGKNINFLLHTEKGFRLFQMVRENLLRNKDKMMFENLELEFLTTSKQVIPILLSASKIKNDFGELTGIVIIGRNITEKKQIERERKQKLRKQKKYIDEIIKRSQIKSEFMSKISHELRTPLNSIIGFSDLLLEKSYGSLNIDQIEFLNDIRTSSKHLLELINQMLDISKIEAGELHLNIKKLHLKKIIHQIHSTIKSLYRQKGLEFEIIGLTERQFIRADPIRIKEIFYNLLSNAIKYTHEGKITLKIHEKDDFFYFDIQDTGIGIAEKNFDVIFEEFKTIENHGMSTIKGVGLGLPLTKRLIQLQGGAISFTSQLGVGSTFTFTIPK